MPPLVHFFPPRLLFKKFFFGGLPRPPPPPPPKEQIACLVYPIFRFLKSEICFVLRSVPVGQNISQIQKDYVQEQQVKVFASGACSCYLENNAKRDPCYCYIEVRRYKCRATLSGSRGGLPMQISSSFGVYQYSHCRPPLGENWSGQVRLFQRG